MLRRKFMHHSLIAGGGIALLGLKPGEKPTIMTVNGPINSNKAGFVLQHEHILVDFIGAADYDENRWDRGTVSDEVLPYLEEVKKLGCNTFIDFTPAFLGRDPLLLKDLSARSGLNIVTNTGYYGAVDNKYLPKSAFDSSAEDLALIWIDEFNNGIGDTGVRPGFIKISVNPGSLSKLHAKLVKAAAITHLETGLTIASHTGPAVPAFEQLEILSQIGVHPSAFIWVHAQNETDPQRFLEASKMGSWISFDGVQADNKEHYLQLISELAANNRLEQVLVSQDAGWYQPGAPWNGPNRKYTAIHTQLLPLLTTGGFSKKQLKQIFETNPQQAFAIGVRKK